MRSLFLAAFCLVGVSTAALGQAQPQSADAAPPKVDATTCRHLLLAPGEEEENVLIFFHGYVSGMRKETAVDVAKFSALSQAVVEACIDDPSAKLLDLFLAKR